MKKYITFTIVTFFILTIPTYAQIAGAESAACNAQFAQLLVEQQVMESKSVVEPVKRIKILLRSADFLWKFDQPTARAYLAEAWKMAEDRFKETGFEKKVPAERGQGMVTILPDQRMEVVRAIAKLDAEWAKKLIEQMLADYDKSRDNRKDFDKTREVDDLLYLAQQNVKSNPELSRYLYRRLMKYPLVSNWYFTFFALYESDTKFADTLYSDALSNYRNETPRRLLFLSAYPFAMERMFGVDKFQIGTKFPPNLVPNPSLQRQFLDVFFTRIANYASSEQDMNSVKESFYLSEPAYMVSALREIEPFIIERFPDLLQRLSIAKSQAASLLSEEMRKDLESKEKNTADLRGSFEERLAAIEKADGEGKLTDYMIVQLVTWRDKNDEQFELVIPWLGKIKDENVRKETINYFWFLRSKLAIKEKRLDDAEKYALKVPEIEHRAILMFDIAGVQSKNAVDVASFFDTLNRLSKLVRSNDNSVSKAQILLGLTNMYEKVNHSVALEELGEAIRVTNNLKDADIFTTTVQRQIFGTGFGFYATFNTPGYNLEETFVELSKKDFEMSLANSKALDDKYYRTLAVIAVAGNCAKNSKPTAKPVRSQ
ncbi:MAG: hypothetical protein ABIV48_09975 [Pyrinomonadaceae bacterium]